MSEEWQDIETAPKDGTDVLLYRTHWSRAVPVVAGWFEDAWYTFDHDGEKVPELGGITHWQPLPPPPTSKQGT